MSCYEINPHSVHLGRTEFLMCLEDPIKFWGVQPFLLLQLLEKALSGYDAQKEAKDAKAAKEPSKVSKTRKSRLAPDPHPPTEVCSLREDVPSPARRGGGVGGECTATHRLESGSHRLKKTKRIWAFQQTFKCLDIGWNTLSSVLLVPRSWHAWFLYCLGKQFK